MAGRRDELREEGRGEKERNRGKEERRKEGGSEEGREGEEKRQRCFLNLALFPRAAPLTPSS